jgi:predicted lipid-binding transport protein (Tim44 family)
MPVIQHQRTARSRTSGENLFVVLPLMAPPSQELEPPANPGRFTMMNFDGMMGSGMWGMSLFGLLVLVVVVLGIAALIKYLGR